MGPRSALVNYFPAGKKEKKKKQNFESMLKLQVFQVVTQFLNTVIGDNLELTT